MFTKVLSVNKALPEGAGKGIHLIYVLDYSFT